MITSKILNIIVRTGYGLDDAYNGSWRIPDAVKPVFVAVAAIAAIILIIGIIFAIHDSGRER